MYRDTILDAAALPVAFVAYTPCFRREAGAAGKDTRGLSGSTSSTRSSWSGWPGPKTSEAEHELLTGTPSGAQRLELPYRVVALAAGDPGFTQPGT